MSAREGPGAGDAGAKSRRGGRDEPQDTRRQRRAPACPPSCALACRVPSAWWQDAPSDPDPWHVAFALHGLDPRRQPPMHPGVHREALRWFAAIWGPDVVIRGVRLAASIPRPHGSPVEPAQLAALADRLDAEGVSAWAAA